MKISKKFALTITNNTRTKDSSLEELLAPINTLLDVLHSKHYETGYLGFEFQKRDPRCAHVHTLLVGDKVPFFKKLNTNKALHVQCDLLKEEADVVRWVTYCHKEEKQSLEERYQQSKSPEDKENRTPSEASLFVSPPVIGVLYSGGHAG